MNNPHITKNTEFHLTIEQRQLVEENHNLIYGFLHHYNIPTNDDTYSIAAIGLCKAACRYTPERGAFSTIAYCSMFSEFKHHSILSNKDSRKVEHFTIPYDFSSYDRDEEAYDTTTLNNLIATTAINLASKDNTIEDSCISELSYNDFLEILPDKLKQVADLYANGYCLSEIAKILGCVPSNVAYYKTQIKQKYLQFISK